MKPEAMALDHPFLKDLSPAHLQILADNALPAHFEAGEVIFREGEMANRFYLIQKGKVALESSDPRGEERMVQEIGAGEVLGWSWLFPPYYWHMDARATEPTEAIFFYGTRLREQAQENHDLGYELMQRVAEIVIRRLQATRRQLLQDTVQRR
jgi:CRP/FNR family cyclic AMP-dependent transcriptional regulator